MKKILLIGLFIFAGLGAQSQVLITLIFGDKLNSPNLEFGLEGGINWSTISGLETNSFARKWNLGFYFDFRLKNQWFLYTGVLVKSNLGVDNLTDNDLNSLNTSIYNNENGERLVGNYSQKLNYFMVPVLAKYRFKSNFYIELGPQFGLMFKSWIEFASDAETEGREAIIKEFNKDQINKLDAGAMFGMGYKFKSGPGWSLGVKYYYGFVDVYKDISGTKNSSIFLKLNIPIGAGEKAKTKNAKKAAEKEEKKAAKAAEKEAKKNNKE